MADNSQGEDVAVAFNAVNLLYTCSFVPEIGMRRV